MQDQTPYLATSVEVVTALGSTAHRQAILRGWLEYRAALRNIGIDRGFQWLDGSFVEDKIPGDIDVVTALYRPPAAKQVPDFMGIVNANSQLFARDRVKKQYMVDAMLVDLDGTADAAVKVSAYYFGLFSHRRGDDLWKGMLQVDLDTVADDQAALAALPSPSAAPATATGAGP
jgi:hypothetical protein